MKKIVIILSFLLATCNNSDTNITEENKDKHTIQYRVIETITGVGTATLGYKLGENISFALDVQLPFTSEQYVFTDDKYYYYITVQTIKCTTYIGDICTVFDPGATVKVGVSVIIDGVEKCYASGDASYLSTVQCMGSFDDSI